MNILHHKLGDNTYISFNDQSLDILNSSDLQNNLAQIQEACGFQNLSSFNQHELINLIHQTVGYRNHLFLQEIWRS